MNRAERRRQSKVTKKQINTQVNLKELRQEITDQVMVLLLAIPLKVVNKRGWKESTLTKFAEDITEEYQRFCDGDLTLEQYKEDVANLIGWRFEKGE